MGFTDSVSVCPVGGVRERSGCPVQPDGAHPQPPGRLLLQPHRFPAGDAALLHDQRRHGARRAPQLPVSMGDGGTRNAAVHISLTGHLCLV